MNEGTPKIQPLYALIDWLNLRQNSDSSTEGLDIKDPAAKTIVKLPLNSEPLDSSPWLTGFIEGDGSFQVRATAPNAKNKYPKVECRFELKQNISINSGYDFEPIMNILAKYLNVELSITKTKSYTTFSLRTLNLKSNDILIKYLDSFPLFSSNYLNYKDWLKALEIYKKCFVNDKSEDIFKQILTVKENINDKRTIFHWDHLQHFWSLYTSTPRILDTKEIGVYGGLVQLTSPATVNETKKLLTNKELIINENRGKPGVSRGVNLINGKSYVGSSVDIGRRLKSYYSKISLVRDKMLINKAILKYGYINFKLEILEYCDPNDVIKREQYYIDQLKPEYNILSTAGSSLGHKYKDEVRLAKSVSRRGVVITFTGKATLWKLDL